MALLLGCLGACLEDDAEWPACEPWDLDAFRFGGPYNIHDSVDTWPEGHYRFTCVFESLAAEEIVVRKKLWWKHVLQLGDCQDEQGMPAAHPLDLFLETREPLPVDLAPGQHVELSFSWRHLPGTLSPSYAWYSLRRTETGELLFAAFADPGPTSEPTVPEGSVGLAGWLTPFEATLGDFACPVELGTCAGDFPQRAVVHFERDGQTVDVVGGTIGDLGDYLVHLGFAGTPGGCDFGPSQPPLHGVLVKKP